MLRNKLKITISLILITLFCGVSVFSQDRLEIPILGKTIEPPKNQCNKFKESGYAGEPISINVVNADVKDILLYVTEQYGFQFVIDKSAKSKPVTQNISNKPWNIIVKDILKAQGFEMIANCPVISIVNTETYFRSLCSGRPIKNIDDSPLYTEFIKLKNVPLREQNKSNNSKENEPNQKVGLSKLVRTVQKRLTKRGTIEVDCRSHYLIITDVRENLKALVRLVEYLDLPKTYKLTEEEYKNGRYCRLDFKESVTSKEELNKK